MSKINHRTIMQIGLASFICLGLGFALGYFSFTKKKNLGPEESTLYAVANGKKIYGSDVWEKIQSDIRELERSKYLIKKKAVEDLILADQSKTLPPEHNPTVTPDKVLYTPEEFDKFLKERNLVFNKMTRKQQEDLVANYKIHRAMLANKMIKESAAQKLEIEWHIPMTYLEAPAQVDVGLLPDLSNAKAPLSVVVFGNYHCPYCKAGYDKIKALTEKYKDKISIRFRFSFRELESSLVYQSALGTFCANEQGKFVDFFNRTFEKPPLEMASLKAISAESQLDSTKFDECLKSNKAKTAVEKDISDAEKLGLKPGSVFYVNGYRLEMQEPLSEIELMLHQGH